MMKRVCLFSLTAVLLSVLPVFAMQQVIIETNKGNITVELDDEKAPVTVANFLAYVDSGHYKDTVFHRVIRDFMIQGGNFTVDMAPKKTGEPIKNEAANGLRNQRGTIAMARTSVVDSATSQFFINLKDNNFLNHKDNSDRGFGYAVFGKVIDGMDVVDRIGTVSTHVYHRVPDVPVDPVIILDVKRVAQ
jgi:peptidyl-prolyl cis-trans isomerase A (cyclophilin A)